MMTIIIKETKPCSDWYDNTNMQRPATMQLIHQMIKSPNRNVLLYSVLSVTFGLGHRLPGAGLIRMVGNSILCVHVCTCVCLNSGSGEKLLSAVCDVRSIFSLERSRVKLQRNTKLWCGPNPSAHRSWLIADTISQRGIFLMSHEVHCAESKITWPFNQSFN